MGFLADLAYEKKEETLVFNYDRKGKEILERAGSELGVGLFEVDSQAVAINSIPLHEAFHWEDEVDPTELIEDKVEYKELKNFIVHIMHEEPEPNPYVNDIVLDHITEEFLAHFDKPLTNEIYVRKPKLTYRYLKVDYEPKNILARFVPKPEPTEESYHEFVVPAAKSP